MIDNLELCIKVSNYKELEMDINYGRPPFELSIKSTEKPEYKVGDVVYYEGEFLEIKRIDGHVYPICLSGGIRVNVEMINLNKN